MLDDVLGYLRCPVCGGGLTRTSGSLRCGSGHSFDIARQGYVSMLPSGAQKNAGDTAAMMAARQAFLAAGHFSLLAETVAGAASDLAGSALPSPGCVVDVGAGTGYYLAVVLDRLPRHAGIALDISKYAARLAAKAHPRAGAVVCDAWRRLPVADGAADLVMNVFAPREGAELRRVLRRGGRLLVVTPTEDHLRELRGPLDLLGVDERKQERLTAKLGPYFDLLTEQDVRGVMSLDHAAVAALAGMGPTAWHVAPGTLADKVGRLPDPAAVTLAVTVSVLRRRD
jgi:23S rRNA (guanine745-N1)-methyltransferase